MSLIKSNATHRFCKDYEKAERAHLAQKIDRLVLLICKNPFQNPPPYEKLKGLKNTYSRRINEQHRLVYTVEDGYILFQSCFGHYED